MVFKLKKSENACGDSPKTNIRKSEPPAQKEWKAPSSVSLCLFLLFVAREPLVD